MLVYVQISVNFQEIDVTHFEEMLSKSIMDLSISKQILYRIINL